MRIKKILTAFLPLFLTSILTSANCDTLFLTPDSSLRVICCRYDDIIYEIAVDDTKKSLMLLAISEPFAIPMFLQKSTSIYHVSADKYLPVYGEEDWYRYELVRYVITVIGNDYSIKKTYRYTDYPRLSESQIDNIVSNAKNILSNDFIKKRYSKLDKNIEGFENDSYVRNIGFLAIGILNGNDECLKLFNDVSEECTGGEGCGFYSELQRVLSLTEFKLVLKPTGYKNFHFDKYLVSRNASKKNTESSFNDEDVKFETRLTALPQVVSYSKLLSHNNRELKVWSTDTLVFDNIKYVHYHVGEDNGTNLVTTFHFAQKIGSNKVFIYDVINDRIND